MGSGRPSNQVWLLVIPLVALLLLCGVLALVVRSRTGFTVPQSVGMATAVPGVVVAKTESLPTVIPAPQIASVLTPTGPISQVQILGTSPTVIPDASATVQSRSANAEPIPGSGVNTGDGLPQTAGNSGQAEPYPAGSSSDVTGSDSGSRVTCNHRIMHVVRGGENLFRIALRYNTTSASIAQLNGITNVHNLRVGQRLTIITCRGNDASSANDTTDTYVVQDGDNLFRIALRFGTTIAAIRAVNGLDSDWVFSGQVLRIP